MVETWGVVYITTGDEKYINQANRSVKSLNSHNNISTCCIVSKNIADKVETKLFDDIITVEDAKFDTRDKVAYLKRTPYSKTVYLDADTIVLGDITPLFRLLDRVDIAFRQEAIKNRIEFDKIPDSFPEVAAGIIAYNSNQSVYNFIDNWYANFQNQIQYGLSDMNIPIEEGDNLEQISSFGRFHDQQPLRKTLFDSDIRFSILPVEYMFGAWGQSYAYFDVKIIHGTNHRRTKWLPKIINNKLGPRVYIGGNIGKIYYRNGDSINVYPFWVRVVYYLDRNLPIDRLADLPIIRKMYSRIKSHVGNRL